ncbi:MAG: FAD-linked oxidase C-terminal domain-containing protein [Caldilineaceae bacterium]
MLTQTQLQPLTKLFNKRQLTTDAAELITYEVDAGFDRGKPDGVFYPESAADVSRLMQWAYAARVPLVARGAGTGLSGGAVAEHGGIIIEFARMNRILALDQNGRNAIVEPGVVNLTLDGEAKRQGLYFPPDPSSQRSSVLGGNIGENSGGPHCFKYGVTTNYVTGLEVVLADGKIVQLGGPALDYPEYDLCGVMVGSEGTLGIITKAYVRLMRNPPGVKTLMVSFHSIEEAGRAVSAVIAAGLVPATLEMMDKKIMGMIEAYAHAGLPVEAEAGLIVEVDGYPAGLDGQSEEVADLLTAHGGYDLRIAQSEEERQKIWYGRKSAAGAMSRLSPSYYLVDVTVPRSRLADMLAAVNEVCDRHGLTAGHVFHAGDGNLHPAILCDARDEQVMAHVFAACDEIIDLCVERKGSITGEHGVGIEKRRYMPVMYNDTELATMLELKAIFDPTHLLNPRKIFPDTLPKVRYASPDTSTPAVIAPHDAAEAAAAFAALTAARRAVTIKSEPATEQADSTHGLIMTTRNLRGVRHFAPDDLYVTVGTGTPVQELQAILAAHQMQTALVAPWPEMTVGDLLATNLNSPLRMRYGALRDNLLATTVALADGRVIQAGRVVVKNVAGYDLTKLFVGSYGTLGLMVDATLKVMPTPRLQRTLAVPASTPAEGLQWAQALMPHLLVSAGVILCAGAQTNGLIDAPYALVMTAEGIAEDVESELAELTGTLVRAGAPQPVAGGAMTSVDAWSTFMAASTDQELLLRTGVPVQAIGEFSRQVSTAAGVWLMDPVHGMAYARYKAENEQAAQGWLTAIRQTALALEGYTVAVHLPDAYSARINRWGYQPSSLALMQQLKYRWDPEAILNRAITEELQILY